MYTGQVNELSPVSWHVKNVIWEKSTKPTRFCTRGYSNKYFSCCYSLCNQGIEKFVEYLPTYCSKIYRFHLYLRLLFNSILIHQEIYNHYLTSSSLPFDKCIRVKRADTQKYHLHSCRLAFQRCIICSLIFMQQLSKLYCLQKEKFLQIYIFYLEKIFSLLL